MKSKRIKKKIYKGFDRALRHRYAHHHWHRYALAVVQLSYLTLGHKTLGAYVLPKYIKVLTNSLFFDYMTESEGKKLFVV